VAASPAQLRIYRSSDFEILYRIDQICFPRGIAYGRFELKVYLQSEGSYSLVAEVGGDVAGFILTEQAAEEGHIITLDVVEAYRRRGIGSLLLAAAEQEAASRGGKRMVLETATTNKAAIALWKKHGYRETGTIANYYGHGQNAFEMQKRLEPKTQINIIP
jgi:ribosomal protein S18 acetylase RimI-like enzyme